MISMNKRKTLLLYFSYIGYLPKILQVLLLLFLLTYNRVSAKETNDSHKVDSLIEYASSESKKGNFNLMPVAQKMLQIGMERNDGKACLYGFMYMGHALAVELNDSVKVYYRKALGLAVQMQDYRALAAIYNALGIYASEMEMNYLSGLSNFMKALEYARLSPDKHSYPVILNNIAMMHYLRNDSNGLKYSLEVIDVGVMNNDRFLVYSGSFVTAYMYYLMGKNSLALHYIMEVFKNGGNYIEYAEAYSLYANILVKLGREREAVNYYRRSLEHVGVEKSNTLAYLNYGNYLIRKGTAAEAISILEKGLAFVNRRNNAFYRYQLYEKLYEAYVSTGNYSRALDYYKKFHNEFVNIFDVEHERAINELRVQYETEKQEKEIHEKELALLKQKQKLNITLFLFFLLIGVLAALIIGQRRKNRHYRQIVRQQHELIQKEKAIEQLSHLQCPESTMCDTTAQLSDEKELKLFAAIEWLMKSERIYRDRNITIKKTAERLSTNHSYLSKAINEQGGMTFSQYVNSYRISEARRLLSESDNDIQIKELAYMLGFSTPETFSASFKKVVGMLPSKFREETRKMFGNDPIGEN